MLKRLPILCAALLALAACSHDNDNARQLFDTGGSPPRRRRPAPTPARLRLPRPPHRLHRQRRTCRRGPATADADRQAARRTLRGRRQVGRRQELLPDRSGTADQHPGKIEVTEVFSYACPACNQFHTTMEQMVKRPAVGAVMTYLPASFRPDENWPLFQRAFSPRRRSAYRENPRRHVRRDLNKTGELATYRPARPGKPEPNEAWPTIDDVAKFYAKYGVDPKSSSASPTPSASTPR
jgi:thiol:disulfide interchange protein DsbA